MPVPLKEIDALAPVVPAYFIEPPLQEPQVKGVQVPAYIIVESMDLLLASFSLLQFPYSILSMKSEDARQRPFPGCLMRAGQLFLFLKYNLDIQLA